MIGLAGAKSRVLVLPDSAWPGTDYICIDARWPRCQGCQYHGILPCDASTSVDAGNLQIKFPEQPVKVSIPSCDG